MSSTSIRTAVARRRPSKLALALAALAIAASAPTVSAEVGNTDCANGVRGCVERQESFFLIPGSADVIGAFVPVKPDAGAQALYEHMLPDGFLMPETPRFFLQAARYHGGTNAPVADQVPGTVEGNGGAGYGTSWMEMALCMRVARAIEGGGTEESWFMVAIGTDGNIAYGGIDLGYPKYRAHTYLDRSDGRNVPSFWSAGAEVVGRAGAAHADPSTRSTTLEMSWREDLEQALPADATTVGIGYFQFPVHKGPKTVRSVNRFMSAAEAQWVLDGGAPDAAVVPGLTAVDRRPGPVEYEIEPDFLRYDDQSEKPLPSLLEGTGATLDDLIDTKGTVPGYAFDIKQGFLFGQEEVVVESDGSST